MEIKAFKDKVLLSKKKDVLRVHLYTKLIQNGIRPHEKDMDLILHLYSIGGYKGKEEQDMFIQKCMEMKMKRSSQSVRNTLSKYTKLKVFKKDKNTYLKLSDDFLPSVECDKLVLQHVVSHLG